MEEWGDSACCSAKLWLKWKFGVGRPYLGIGDLQGTGGDGLGEDLALRRHHRHGLVQGSTWGKADTWGYQNPQISTSSPSPPWSLPGTAGELLPVLMARLPGGSVAAGTTMPGGGFDAGGSAAGELCSISCRTGNIKPMNFSMWEHGSFIFTPYNKFAPLQFLVLVVQQEKLQKM